MLNRSVRNGGYIALFSVVIITAVLLTALLSTNAGGFMNSAMVLQTTLKEELTSHAEGCVEIVRGKLALDATYNGNETIVIEETPCLVNPITSPGEIEVTTLSTDIVVNIRAQVNPSTLEYTSWEELPSFE